MAFVVLYSFRIYLLFIWRSKWEKLRKSSESEITTFEGNHLGTEIGFLFIFYDSRIYNVIPFHSFYHFGNKLTIFILFVFLKKQYHVKSKSTYWLPAIEKVLLYVGWFVWSFNFNPHYYKLFSNLLAFTVVFWFLLLYRIFTSNSPWKKRFSEELRRRFIIR